MKVLLVEDEEMLNNIIAKRLRVESMTVDCCFDGETALDHINTSSYDVVVMDVMIPKMDGLPLYNIYAKKVIKHRYYS